MIELVQITNDPEFAARCEPIAGVRVFFDLESMGKAERQAGRDTFISRHRIESLAPLRAVVRRNRLMVRVNPLHAGTAAELDAVLAHRPDLVMLPMFDQPGQVRDFSRLVAGRARIVPLLETAGALATLDEWIGTPGLEEVYVGLNDLHISLGQKFMFEALADGTVDRVAGVVRAHGLRFGFGGIARLDEGLLLGRYVLGEHLRLGSQAVILSRTFHREPERRFEDEVALVREAEGQLARRTPGQVQADARRTAERIRAVVATLPPQ